MDDKALLHSVHLRQKDFVTERADDTTKTAKNPSSKNEFPARKQGLKARSCVAYWKQSGCHLPHNAFTAVCSSVSGISQKWQITRSKNNNSLILAFMGTMGKWTLNWTINYYVPDIFSSMYLLLIFFVSSLFGNIWGIGQVTQPSVALQRHNVRKRVTQYYHHRLSERKKRWNETVKFRSSSNLRGSKQRVCLTFHEF